MLEFVKHFNIEEYYNGLPLAQRKALEESNWRLTLDSIFSDDGGLLDDEQDLITREVGIVLVGAESMDGLLSRLTKIVGVQDHAERLLQSVNTKIFQPISARIREFEEENRASDFAEPDELSFDLAIELLEITDIKSVSESDLPRIAKRAKKRWHPDKIAHQKDEEETLRYNKAFQQIEPAIEMIRAYLNGEFKAGQTFSGTRDTTAPKEPEDVIRENAATMQETLRGLWAEIKQKKYKWTVETVQISDGFVLREMLTNDFKEDIAMLSIISIFYSTLLIGIVGAIATAISPVLGGLVGIFILLQIVSCVLGFLPLSRFWLPEAIQPAMFWFINFGLGIFNWADRESKGGSVWVGLLVAIPSLFALAIKYVVLFPLYEIAKLVIGDKVVGVVNQPVNYYGGAAEWYVDQLLNQSPNDMTKDQLFDFSYVYSELSDVKSKT